MRKNRKLADKMVWGAVLIMTALYVLPMLWVGLAAFKTQVEMFSVPPKILPGSFELSNFRAVLSGNTSLVNSLVITLGSTVCVLILAIPAGYAFARFGLRHGRDIEFWILSTRMLPPIAIIIPLFIIFQDLDLFDSRIGMILAYTAFNLPFAIWMIAAGFRQVPIEIEHAAMIDGGTLRQTMFNIAIPLAKSGIAVAAIFSFIWAWNDLLFGLMLTASTAKTLPVSLSEYTGQVNIRWELMAAMSIVQALPVLLFTILIQRHLVAGLTMGGVEN